jgi:hypothetical protein
MEPKCLIQYPEEPTTGHYPETNQPMPFHSTSLIPIYNLLSNLHPNLQNGPFCSRLLNQNFACTSQISRTGVAICIALLNCDSKYDHELY